MSIIEGQKINNTFFISINNPKSKNSMVLGFHPQLQSKIDEAENSKDINSIIIFGEGGFFCAGGDLNSLKTRRDMTCLLYTSPSPRDRNVSRMPSSA